MFLKDISPLLLCPQLYINSMFDTVHKMQTNKKTESHNLSSLSI